MGTPIPIPLRWLLPALMVTLVAAGAAAIGAVGGSALGGELTGQADAALSGCVRLMLAHKFLVGPNAGPETVGAGPAAVGSCDTELLSPDGRLLTPPLPGAGPGPDIPAAASWLAAHEARPVTVPGTGTGGSWRVVLTGVSYQAERIIYVYGPDDVGYQVSGRAGAGQQGMLVVMAALAGASGAVAGFTRGYVLIACVAVALLAVAACALARAFLRPLRWAARLAAQAGPAAASQLAAPRAAEIAAGRRAAEMTACLAAVSLELRAPVGRVRGLAQSFRLRGDPRPAAADAVMCRLDAELDRVQNLLMRLTPGPG